MDCQLGSSSFDAVSADPISKEFKEIKKYSTNVEALLDLEAGRIDAVVLDEIVARYYIAQKEKKIIKLYLKYLMAILVKKSTELVLEKKILSLKKQLMKKLDEMKKDGSYDKIYEKWFGKRG